MFCFCGPCCFAFVLVQVLSWHVLVLSCLVLPLSQPPPLSFLVLILFCLLNGQKTGLLPLPKQHVRQRPRASVSRFVLSCCVLACLALSLLVLLLFCLVNAQKRACRPCLNSTSVNARALPFLGSSCLVVSCLVLSCLFLSCLFFSCLVLSWLFLVLLSTPPPLVFFGFVLSCLVEPCLVLSCLVWSCRVMSCLDMSCLVLSCFRLGLSCLGLFCFCFTLVLPRHRT